MTVRIVDHRGAADDRRRGDVRRQPGAAPTPALRARDPAAGRARRSCRAQLAADRDAIAAGLPEPRLPERDGRRGSQCSAQNDTHVAIDVHDPRRAAGVRRPRADCRQRPDHDADDRARAAGQGGRSVQPSARSTRASGGWRRSACSAARAITELRHGGENTRDLLVTVEEAPPTTIGYGGGVEVRPGASRPPTERRSRPTEPGSRRARSFEHRPPQPVRQEPVAQLVLRASPEPLARSSSRRRRVSRCSAPTASRGSSTPPPTRS